MGFLGFGQQYGQSPQPQPPVAPRPGLMGWLRDLWGGWAGPKASRAMPVAAEMPRERINVGPAGVVLPRFNPYISDDADHAARRKAYRRMLSDYSVKPAMQSKVLGVAALDLQIHPADKKDRECGRVADFNRYCFTERLQGGIPRLVENILTGALVDGFSVNEKRLDYEQRGQWHGKYVLSQLKPKPAYDDCLLESDQFGNITGIRGQAYNAGETWHPGLFVIYSNAPLYSDPLGNSDLKAAYRSWWIKSTAWQLRTIALEKFAVPPVWGKYQNPQHESQLAQGLAALKSSNYIVTHDSVTVAALDLAGKSADIFHTAIEALDQAIFVAITGAFLQSLQGTTQGGRGSSKVHKTTSDLFRWHLAEIICSLLNDRESGIITDLCDLNFPPQSMMKGYPRATLSATDPNEMLLEMQIDEKLHGMGVKLVMEELYERYGRTQPDDDDEVLPGMPQAGLPAHAGVQAPTPAAAPASSDDGSGGGGSNSSPFADRPAPGVAARRPFLTASTSAATRSANGNTLNRDRFSAHAGPARLRALAGKPPGLELFCGGPGSGVPGPCPTRIGSEHLAARAHANAAAAELHRARQAHDRRPTEASAERLAKAQADYQARHEEATRLENEAVAAGNRDVHRTIAPGQHQQIAAARKANRVSAQRAARQRALAGQRAAMPTKPEPAPAPPPPKPAAAPPKPEPASAPAAATNPHEAAWAGMATNPHRAALVAKGKDDLARLKQFGLLKDGDSVIVHGSMVGNKAKPGDLDMVVLVDKLTPEQMRWNHATVSLHSGRQEMLGKSLQGVNMPLQPGKDVQVFFGSRRPTSQEYDYGSEARDYLSQTNDKYGTPIQVSGPAVPGLAPKPALPATPTVPLAPTSTPAPAPATVKPTESVPAPAAPKAGPPGAEHVVERVKALHANATHPNMTHSRLNAATADLESMPKARLLEASKAIGISQKPGTVGEAAQRIRQKILDRKGSFDRTGGSGVTKNSVGNEMANVADGHTTPAQARANIVQASQGFYNSEEMARAAAAHGVISEQEAAGMANKNLSRGERKVLAGKIADAALAKVAEGGAVMPVAAHLLPGASTVPATTSTPAQSAQHVADAVQAHGGRHNLAPLHRVREHLAGAGITSRTAQDAAIHEARKSGLVGGSALEGRHGVDPAHLAASIPDPGNPGAKIGYLSSRVTTHSEANPLAQQEPWSCGPSSIRLALAHLGEPDPGEPWLVELCGSTEAEGTPPDRMASAVQALGLTVEPIHGIDPGQLSGLLAGRVALAPIQAYGSPSEMANDQAGHWVCIIGASADTVTLLDPAGDVPERVLALAEFVGRWHDQSSDGTTFERFGIMVSRGWPS